MRYWTTGDLGGPEQPSVGGMIPIANTIFRTIITAGPSVNKLLRDLKFLTARQHRVVSLVFHSFKNNQCPYVSKGRNNDLIGTLKSPKRC